MGAPQKDCKDREVFFIYKRVQYFCSTPNSYLMEYQIYRKHIPSQFIQIELTLQCHKNESIQLQLPAWRPGRYELANYAQKLKSISCHASGEEVKLTKLSKDLWQFEAIDTAPHLIQYEFHASQMDAGGSWSDDEQLYLNFINFIFQIKGREKESIQVRLDLPDDYCIATALPVAAPFVLEARDFQHLIDSPLIASPKLKHHRYQVGPHTFHLWFKGGIYFDPELVLSHFERFTEKQIQAFGDFPASDYHFLFQLLPYKHYHGVEHQYSTVITLGPATELATKKSMDLLMGISSHELYHFWNVCRIRPKELLPYDFAREVYLDSGVVLEGVTSYMGDLFLLKSGYYTLEEYAKIIEKLVNREFELFGWRNQSIVESSFDLWLDGYKPGIPDRKVSIYNRGALISLCLDLLLLDEGSSLSQVMKTMWTRFGQNEVGYALTDFQSIIGQHLGNPKAAEDFFIDFIYGKKDLLPLLKSLLASVGISVHENRRNALESDFGILLDQDSAVKSLHPDSPAYSQLMVGDVVQNQEMRQNYAGDFLIISVRRNLKTLTVSLPQTSTMFYLQYQLLIDHYTEKTALWGI